MENTISVDSGAQSTDQQTQLSLNDIQNLLIIVDLASQRGAFKGPELSQVGQVFDRVTKFLQSVAPPQPEQNVNQQPEPLKPAIPVFNNIGSN